ncbi:thiamine biosynthesis protein ApbE [Clostridium carboxidivorans P7]|uniref:FAD:protein FMN transferase n=1 Tax=Clostridium carboxidivorans P7 TaxID=536227 RepID=C6PNX3_9CLOT|nr:FAD:protein FMN transferase [Clostridium carboxidivorans]AKN31270.1 thiamine biosynthesis protein ApbE [Clostridium carboxidivorans P7]EET89051.1 ApbE family lipoprotein [Clostridium carboxidivorans P7]EFG88397.1 ApbE family protein [Clostridium carboxidivorans P7]
MCKREFFIPFFRARNKKVLTVREFYVLGTVVQLKVYGSNGKIAVEEAVNRLNDIDNKMSVFKEYSEISMINENAGISNVEVSKDTYFVVKEAVKYSELSEGGFDPTIRPVVELWGIGTDKVKVPGDNEIGSKLKLVNYKDIILNEKDRTIKLRNKGQNIDLGGIAKGYAADEVKNILIKNNIKSALINLGGNIYALGKKPDRTQWYIGIQNPFGKRGEFVGFINVKNKSVVTSGNYERYFISNEKRFHHIIDPKTGYPSDSKIISSTIISDYSIDGDGLSTGVYIMGLDKSIKLIESIKGIDAIFITENREIYITSGIKNKFKLVDENFVCRKE